MSDITLSLQSDENQHNQCILTLTEESKNTLSFQFETFSQEADGEITTTFAEFEIPYGSRKHVAFMLNLMSQMVTHYEQET